MRRFLAAFALSILLAGCATDPGTPPAAEAATADSTPEAEAEIDFANEAPTAILAADSVSGKAPLDVVLRLTGSDPEGQDLQWVLDLDGDGQADLMGSGLPHRVEHQFPAGNHHVQLAVHDGNRATTTSLDIAVEA